MKSLKNALLIPFLIIYCLALCWTKKTLRALPFLPSHRLIMKGITTSLLGNPWLVMFKTHHHNIFLIWFHNGPHQLNSNRRQIRNSLVCDIITGSYSHDSNYKEPAGWPQKCTEIENANDGATIWNVKVNIWVSRTLHLHLTVILKSPILLGYAPTEGRVFFFFFK